MSDAAGRPSLRTTIDAAMYKGLPQPAYQVAISGYARARKHMRPRYGRQWVLPDFVIIGAAKAGTTSLYGWLSQHPHVMAASQKEVHYFDYNYFRGEDWYRRHFPRQRERELFAAEHGCPFLTGEASPSYLSHAWAPQRLAGDLPRAKLIVSLRNPVDRAYSQFQMSRREDEEPLESFSAAIDAERDRLGPELARTSVDRRYQSWPIGCFSYLMRSRYVEQVQRWFALMPRERFHFVVLEELASDPQRVLDHLHAFLDLPPHTYGELPRMHLGGYESEVDAATRARLNEYFRPHNERLYELLGIDLGWERRDSLISGTR